jgi:hypothetical protein
MNSLAFAVGACCRKWQAVTVSLEIAKADKVLSIFQANSACDNTSIDQHVKRPSGRR